MPVNNDGKRKAANRSTKSEVSDRSLHRKYNENFTFTDEFQGFEKIPQVLLTRIDITPYINSKEAADIEKTPQSSKDLSIHTERLSQECKVHIIRDDLNKLLLSFNKCSNLNVHNCLTTSFESEMGVIKCQICDKEYYSEKRFQNHQDNNHVIYKPKNEKTPKRVSFSDHVVVHELNECRKCMKIFENYQLLHEHMKETHKKHKVYECYYCNKQFLDRMSFKIHIKLHCNICGVLLENKIELNMHRRSVCRVVKLYKCKTCEESYFGSMDLRDHSYQHLSTQSFVCDICKDQFQNKCALTHHISFLHSDKGTSDLYAMPDLGSDKQFHCNFCEFSSVDEDIIRKHVGILPDLNNKTMTGYEDFYFCDKCFLKFNTKTIMLQHKQTHFSKNSHCSQYQQQNILKNCLLMNNINEHKTTNTSDVPVNIEPKIVLENIEKNIQPLAQAEHVDIIDVDEYDAKLNSETSVVDSEASIAQTKYTKVIDIDPLNLKKHEIELKSPLTHAQNVCIVNVNDIDILNLKKPIVDHKRRKTILSKFQCEQCKRYFSRQDTLNRHIKNLHSDNTEMHCNQCGESFLRPSSLRKHKCLWPYGTAETESTDFRSALYYNYNGECQNSFNDLNATVTENCSDDNAFEFPAPIVEFHEGYHPISIATNGHVVNNNMNKTVVELPNSGYKIIMQEVPIEF